MPAHTIVRDGIFDEKLLMLITEKKKGRKTKRYITDMETHMNLSFAVNSLPLFAPFVDRKKARAMMPAPRRKSINLKN
jgi:hypothetical protein